ncbi:unnamed protein product [Urochloa humidicola]
MAPRRAAGINRRQLRAAASYHRAFYPFPLTPPRPPVPAVGGDPARRASPSSDIEDPPQLGLPPAANPSRGGAPAHVPGAGVILHGRLDLVPPPRVPRERAPPPPLKEDDEGSSRHRRRRRQADAATPEEIYEVLRAIPGLAKDDLLKAYSKLLRDDRQFRSLMALPGDMRKDWLLMEIGNGQ